MYRVFEDYNGGVFHLSVFSIDLANGDILKEATFLMDEESNNRIRISADNGSLFVRYGFGSTDSLVILMDSSAFTVT